MVLESSHPLLKKFSEKISHRVPITHLQQEDYLSYGDFDLQKRLLKTQISFRTDQGSRKYSDIELHAEWLNNELLKQQSSRILDLGCGPGFYTHCFSRFGHQCTGIDISSFAIEYANEIAEEENINCRFIKGDFLSLAFPVALDLIIMPYSIFNQLNDHQSEILIKKIFRSLKPTGIFYLEAFHYLPQEVPYRTDWYSSEGDDFLCPNPHLCFIEKYWEEPCKTLRERFFIFDLTTGQLTTRANALYLYTHDDYQKFLRFCGFKKIDFPEAPPGTGRGSDRCYLSIIATKG